MSLLLTDNACLGSSDGMMPGFLVEGGYEKSGKCSDIAYFVFRNTALSFERSEFVQWKP